MKKPAETSHPSTAARKQKNVDANSLGRTRNLQDAAMLGLTGNKRPSKLLRADARANRRLQAGRTAAKIAAASVPKIAEIAEITAGVAAAAVAATVATDSLGEALATSQSEYPGDDFDPAA